MNRVDLETIARFPPVHGNPASALHIKNRSSSCDWSSSGHCEVNSSTGPGSIHLVSPVCNKSDTFNVLSGHSPIVGGTLNPTYGYYTQQPSATGPIPALNHSFYSNELPDSSHSHGTTSQNHHNFQQPEFSLDGSSAAIMAAAQEMIRNIDFTSMAPRPAQYSSPTHPAVASTEALFQSVIQDSTVITSSPSRSPSPLYEIDGKSSPELREVFASAIRRNTFSSSDCPLHLDLPRRSSVGAKPGRKLSPSALDPEEKAMRAALADGLSKLDKRRMQNKLAQRAFRARNKVVNKQAAGPLEDLEVLAEEQADRIDKLNDLAGRLRWENQGLKTQHIHEATNLRPA